MIDWLRSRCLLGHDWGRWYEIQAEGTVGLPWSKVQHEIVQLYQKRECNRCNKTQLKRLL